MLSLSKKVHYALIALGYLAERQERVASAREIAQAFNLPLPLLMNILKSLNQRGIVKSSRGTKGGYQINIKAEETSLYDLVEIVDGPVQISQCSKEETGCKIGQGCPVQAPIATLHRKLAGFLREVKLSELIVRNRPIEVLTAEFSVLNEKPSLLV